MTLRNAFGNLATEAKQDDIAALAAALVTASQAIQAAVAAIDAKTVAVNTGAVTVANQPSQPLTDAQLRASAVPVSLDLSPLATEETVANINDVVNNFAQEIPDQLPVAIAPYLPGVQPSSLAMPVALAKEHIFDYQSPLVSMLNPAIGNVLVFQDCQQYRSVAVQITTGAGISAGVITLEGSNAIDSQAFWVPVPLYDQASTGTAAITSITLAASTNRFVAGPVHFRYFRIKVSTAVAGGQVSCGCMFRMAPFSVLPNTATAPLANVSQIGGTNIVTAGVSGLQAVGGNIAQGLAATSNPVPSGGVDYSGLTRREITDSQGHQVVVGPDPTRSAFSVPVSMRDAMSTPGQWSQAELLEFVLMELKLQSFYLKELPVLLNMPGAYFKEEISDFLGNPDKLT